jgi:hypothetical protein
MKKLVVVVLLFSNYWGIAQVTLQPLLPQVGLFQKSQLWNIVAINTSSIPLQCYIVLSLQDRQSGTEVISATSSDFTLEKGSKQLNVASLTPIQYTYFSFGGDKVNDFLTTGSYMACFKLIGVGHESGDLGEACVPFDVEPLSPPMLIMPADSSVLQVQPTQFTWQPPAPLTMFQQLHYELLIAEILPGQRPEEAVELNAPFFMDLNVTGNIMNYTGTYPTFEQGKWYAWQVVAQDGQNYAAKTQVWDFQVTSAEVPVVRPANGNYILLKSDKDASEGVHSITGTTVGIKYYCFDKAYTATVLFIGPDGKTIEQTTAQVAYGDNFLGYNLGSQFKKGTTYSVEIIDSKNNKNIAFFSMK